MSQAEGKGAMPPSPKRGAFVDHAGPARGVVADGDCVVDVAVVVVKLR